MLALKDRAFKYTAQLDRQSLEDAVSADIPSTFEAHSGCRVDSARSSALELGHLVQELLQGIVVNLVGDGRDESLGLLSTIAAKRA